MRAISLDMRRAALIRQDEAAQSRVLLTSQRRKDVPIMASGTALRIPSQRPAEQPCPPYCTEDHSGEPPGARSHWGIGVSIPLPDGTVLLADINARDGMPAEVVLGDSDGRERRLTPADAIAYGQAIIAAAYASGQAVSR